MSKAYIKELIEMSKEALNCELENVPVEQFRDILRMALQEQDRDTIALLQSTNVIVPKDLYRTLVQKADAFDLEHPRA